MVCDDDSQADTADALRDLGGLGTRGDGHRVDLARWQVIFDEVMARIAGRFARVEPRCTARAFMLGLLSDVGRKTCWGLAEHAGHDRPDAMQRLLRQARWDAEAVRNDLHEFLVAHLGHPDSVLISDETGDVKKGSHTVAVQRQYTGTAGRIENVKDDMGEGLWLDLGFKGSWV